jgi:alpha-ketoglutarate-dependent taurine dioxygenase
VETYEHASTSFAWKADSFASLDECVVDVESDLSRAYEEVRSGRGFVVVRGLSLDRGLEAFIESVREVGTHFGELLSQNAQGELVGHVIDASSEDPTPRMYRSNLELRPHNDITAMISLACWQKAQSGGGSVVVSAVTVHDEIRRRAPGLLAPLYRGYHYHRLGEQAPDDEPTTPYRIPVFARRNGQLSCRYQRMGIAAGHRDRDVPLTDEDVAAFNLFDEIARAPENRMSFFLERGDMIVLNNYTVMHARTQFQNFPERERQRRLIRLWLDREGFRDVPREFNHFATNGVPAQEGAACTYDFKKLYQDDPVATGGVPRILQ